MEEDEEGVAGVIEDDMVMTEEDLEEVEYLKRKISSIVEGKSQAAPK